MNERYSYAKKVTIVGGVCNAFLGIVKLVFGYLGSSHALLADGVHSLSDLLTDGLVLIASKYGSQAADDDHPYGHQRIETAATFFLSLLLVVVGVAIFYDGLKHVLYDNHDELGYDILVVAIISIGINELLFHYTISAGKKIGSKLLIANAWHHRSDAASSAVVCVGVGGNMLGFVYFDPLAASLVGILIVKMGWKLGWRSMSELIDTSVDVKLLDKIKNIINTTPGVVELHQLRTRFMGGAIFVDVHLIVGSKLSVSEGHYIGQAVALNLRRNVNLISDVTVHIDPEDDERVNPSVALASRSELMPQLHALWQSLKGYDGLREIVIHYLDGKIHLQVYIAAKRIDQQGFIEQAKNLKDIEEVTVYQELL